MEGTAVSVGAGLGTGILEGNPPSFYAPSTDSFFGEGGCVAPAVRSGTGRHTFRRRPNGVVSIFSRRFFELARSIFTRSGGTFSSTFFRSFRPLSHARFARFVVRETHTDAQTRQAFFSFRIGVLILCSWIAVLKFKWTPCSRHSMLDDHAIRYKQRGWVTLCGRAGVPASRRW